jgi:catechol 2,3-dioxygenase-like lactoylglutathione lyase family enzyme
MDVWYSRPIFFVKDPTEALTFYVDKLGFKQDWEHVHEQELIVVQVSRDGFELILNKDATRAGSGRIYFHLDDHQVQALRQEVESRGLTTKARHWGMPITEIADLDGNELFFDALST